ncbi:HNH endonuclease signature motif containing protein [Corynebacterium timonense]|uniref:HNH endonuclease n=1 Tax=Corynebacterium timonense TaxID=441500 RepID=A0A1H1P1C9_9CORY|nr:HNH endonuclease signature motif containing protein [Corynebacterium timonense]SDS04820.1 HNH endonuclease [Corynebacterium timonense]
MGDFHSVLDQERGRVIDVLVGFDKQEALNAGINNAQVNDWKRIHDAYFGRTRCTRLQRVALIKARANRVTLSKLAVIERAIAHIADEAARWRARHALLEVRGRCETLRRQAKAIVPAKEPAPPRPGVRFSSSHAGHRRLTVIAPERVIADVEHALRSGLDAARAPAEHMLEAFVRILRGGGAVPEGTYRPILMVPIDVHLHPERTDAGVTLHATDGTSVTLRDYLARTYGEALEVAAFHPVRGALDLFRTQRFANDKQRTLMRMVQPTCTVPGCRLPSDLCEIHHITAWKNGGTTNLDNLAPLCRYHNRVNDDDAHVRKRGRIRHVAGRCTWVSPRGYAVPASHPASAMQVLFGDPVEDQGRRSSAHDVEVRGVQVMRAPVR